MNQIMDDQVLLRRFVEERANEAFEALVERHVNLVYFAALRQTGGNAAMAEDVVQAVFTDLARKAASLVNRPALAGWLYTSTRYAAANARRAEGRRRAREQEAYAMQEIMRNEEAATDWDRLRPVIDDALHALGDTDREAVLLRFFEGRPFAEIGAALRLTEEAARKRVERALDKMAGVLARRGVTSTSAAVGAAMAAQATLAAPSGLATGVTGVALSGAAAAGGVLALLASMKATAVAGAVAAVATGAAIYNGNQLRHSEVALAAARQEHAAERAALANVQQRLTWAEQRATAAETDNALLLAAIADATTTKSIARSAAGGTPQAASEPITRELVNARYRRAQELVREGNWEAALPELLWCYDEGMVRVESFSGVRASFLTSELGRLAEKYPPAAAALRERRDRAEQRMGTHSAGQRAAGEFASLNKALNEERRTLELLDKLAPDDPRRRSMGPAIFPRLVEERRYADAVRAIPYETMARVFDSMTQPRPPTDSKNAEKLEAARRRGAVTSAATNVEALAGAGDVERARELARKILSYDNTVETRQVIERHAARAGRPEVLQGL